MEISYHKLKTTFYFALSLLLALASIFGLFLLFRNTDFSSAFWFFLVLIVAFIFMIGWTVIYLGWAIIEKWAVKIDTNGLVFNKSLGGFFLEYHQIESVDLYLQTGYKQIGLKMADRKIWLSTLNKYQKIWVWFNKKFSGYDLIIPGYLINENPALVVATIDELIK